MGPVRRRLGVLFLALTVIGSLFMAPAALASAGAEPEQPGATQASKPGGQFVPLPEAVRGVDIGSMAASATQTVQLAGRSGIPAVGVSGVTAQVIVGSPTASGSVRAFANGAPNPAATTVAFTSGVPYTSAQSVIRLNSAGEANFFNNSTGTLRLVVDVTGYYLAESQPGAQVYVPLSNTRIVDTRSALGVPTSTPVPANGSVTFQVSGRGGLPAAESIGAVKLNVTEASATQAGAWRIHFPGTTSRTAYGHYVAGQRQATTMITTLPADGRLSLHNVSTGNTHYLVEVVGYYRALTTMAAGTRFHPVQPARLLDTATANGVPTTTPVPARGTISVSVAGRAGVPASGASVVALMVIARSATAPGELVVYPGGTTRPGLGNLSFPVSSPGANLLWVPVGASGKIDIYNNSTGTVHLWGDVQAYGLPALRPAAPTQVSATAADRAAAVTWQPPTDDGGAPIARYTVTASPGGATATSTSTSTTVSGLANGTEYTFTVTATNAVGASPPSTASAPVVPALPTPPGRAVVTEAYPRDGEVRVSWSPPDVGADSVTRYRVVANPGGASVEVGPTATRATVAGLTNGAVYTFTVVAINANGTGPASPPSEPVSPRPPAVPVAPLITSAVPRAAAIDLGWTPAMDGGSPVTGYTVTVQPGGRTVDVPAGTTAAAITGLTNGTAYTLSVVARNKAGAGAPAVTAPLTPDATRAPDTPTDIRVTALAAGTLKVTWTPPADPGTAAVTGYTVTATGTGGKTVTSTQPTVTITGLQATAEYTITVVATNQHGTGSASTPSAPLVPALSVKAAPKVLSTAALNTLRAVHGDGTLEFVTPPTEVTSLAPGAFLILNAHPNVPDGLFRKVAAVERGGGLVVVSTVAAALDDVLGAGGMTFDETVGGADIQRVDPVLPGVAVSTAADDSGEIVVSFSGELHKQGPVFVEFEAGLTPILHMGFNIGPSGVKTHVKVGAKVRFSSKLKVGLAGDIKKTVPVAELKLAPVTIAVGPAPIVIVPTINVSVTISMSGEVGLEVDNTYSREVFAEMKTNNADVTSFDVVNRPAADNGIDFTPYGSLSVKGGLAVGLSMMVYGVAGPGIKVGPYVKVDADITKSPWWTARAGIEGSVSLELDVFTVEIARDWTLAEASEVIAQAPGPWDGMFIVPGGADIGTGETAQFQPSTLTGQPPPVTWKLLTGPGRVDQQGRYTSTVAGNAEIEATPTEGDKEPARAYLRVGTRPSAPLPTVTPAPLSLKVTWPAATPGDLPIREYAVTTVPPTTTKFIPATSATTYSTYIQALSAGQEYYVVVTAITNGLDADSAPVGPIRPGAPLTRTGTNVLISSDAYGKPDSSGVAGKQGADLSGNGRYAFFVTAGNSNLAPPDVARPDNLAHYLVRKDLVTGEIELASRGLDGRTPASMPAYILGYTLFLFRSSADGNVVAFPQWFRIDGQYRLRILVHNLSARTTWEATAGMDPTLDAEWPRLSADGEVVIYEVRTPDNPDLVDEHIWRKQRTGGAAVRITQCVAPYIPCSVGGQSHTSMSSDGNRIGYTVGPPFGEVGRARPVLWEAATGSARNFMPGASRDEAGGLPVISPDGKLMATTYGNYATNPWTTGLAVAPVSDGSIAMSDLVLPTPPTDTANGLYPVDISADQGSGYLLGYELGEYGKPVRFGLYDPRSSTNGLLPQGSQGWLNVSDDARVVVWVQICDEDAVCRADMSNGVWAQQWG